jgi:hypothetical protein
MTEHPPERIWSNIDIPKTVAGVLAAVSAAVIGSFLGVAGTLVGAAIASVVGSVGTELYNRFIHRGSQKIKSTFVAPAAAAVGTPPVANPLSEGATLYGTPKRDRDRDVRWGRVVAIAASLFLLAVALVTVFELATHKSIADAVGRSSGRSTTIGSVLTGNEKRQPEHHVTPAPSESPSATPSTTEPTPGDEPTRPTQAPPSQTPTDQPPTDQPTQPTQGGPTGQGGTQAPGNGSQQQNGFNERNGNTPPTPDSE